MQVATYPPFGPYMSGLATLDKHIHELLHYVAEEDRSRDSRIRYSDLVRRALSPGSVDVDTIALDAWRRVCTKSLHIIEKHLANVSRRLEACASAHSPDAVRRRAVCQDLSNLGAFIRQSLLELSASRLPPQPKTSNESQPAEPLTPSNELQQEHRQQVLRQNTGPEQRTELGKRKRQVAQSEAIIEDAHQAAKASGSAPSVSEDEQRRPAKKTKFELIREAKRVEYERKRQEAKVLRENREREQRMTRMEIGKRKRQVASSEVIIIDQPQPVDSEVIIIDPPHPAESEVMLVDLPSVPRLITVPVERRKGDFDLVEKVINSMVTKQNGEFASAAAHFSYEDSRCESFATVGQYAKFWLPLLKEEFRASVNASMRQERSHFERHRSPCRLPFIVQEVPELSGADHFMTLGMDVKEVRAITRNYGGEEFHAGKARTNDMIFLESMVPISNSMELVPGRTALGLVQNVSVERNKIIMKVCVSFGSPCDTPNKGRLIRVSRLCTSATFQRQVEAMYTLGNVPDGVLWPILEPKLGWDKNIEAVQRVEGTAVDAVKAPFSFVGRLLSDNTLNGSQAEAIKTVVRACTPIFKQHSGSKTNTDSSHGGMTLIQGPPGTGKTSTIVGLLSTLLFANTANVASRAIDVEIDGVRQTFTAPPVRVLVCAPSNGAVDELMTRVMAKGLTTRDGQQACPKIVRVGAGSTKEELQALELRRMAGIDDLPSVFDEAIAASGATRQEHLAEVRHVNHKISPLDKEQKWLRKRLNTLIDQKGEVDEGSRLEECKHVERRLKYVSESLTALHNAKHDLHRRLDSERKSSKDLEEGRKRDSDRKMAKILNSCVIVFATLSSSGSDIVQRLGTPFDVTIVDEAAQCVEPDILIPVTAGRRGKSASVFSHLVMVGDPNQLPATVLSENKAVSSRMGCSMFQRFSDSAPEQVHMLDTQYRMHPRISLFPNRQFYKGLLLDGASVRQSSMAKPFHNDPKHRFGPLTFIDTKNAGFRETYSSRSGSVGNPDEAQAIVCAISALVRLHSTYDFNNEIAVLTPYREQVFLIKRHLRREPDLEKLAVEVSTVDGIQGREKSIVFLSTVRGSNARSIGFVRDDRRMNVALTRARDSVIIFGNGELLGNHSVSWKSLVSQCTEDRVRLECPRDDRALFPESQSPIEKSRQSKKQLRSSSDKNCNERQRSEAPHEREDGKRSKPRSHEEEEKTHVQPEPRAGQKEAKGLRAEQSRTHSEGKGLRSEQPSRPENRLHHENDVGSRLPSNGRAEVCPRPGQPGGHNDRNHPRSDRLREPAGRRGFRADPPRVNESDTHVRSGHPHNHGAGVQMRAEHPRNQQERMGLRPDRSVDYRDGRGLRPERDTRGNGRGLWSEAPRRNEHGLRHGSERPRNHNEAQRSERFGVHNNDVHPRPAPSSSHDSPHQLRSAPRGTVEYSRNMGAGPSSGYPHDRSPRPLPYRRYDDRNEYGRGIRSGPEPGHRHSGYPRSEPHKHGPYEDGKRGQPDPYENRNRPASNPNGDQNLCGNDNDKGHLTCRGSREGGRRPAPVGEVGEEGRPNKRPRLDGSQRQNDVSRSSSGGFSTTGARAATQVPVQPRIVLRSVPVEIARSIASKGVSARVVAPTVHKAAESFPGKNVSPVGNEGAQPNVRRGFMPVSRNCAEPIANKSCMPVESNRSGIVANSCTPVPAKDVAAAVKPDAVMGEQNKVPRRSAFLPTRSRYGLGEGRQRSTGFGAGGLYLTPAPKSSKGIPQREQPSQGVSELQHGSRQRLGFGPPGVTQFQPNGISPRERRAPRGFHPTCRRGEEKVRPPAPMPPAPVVRAPPIPRSRPISLATSPSGRRVGQQ